jgi:Domain of unknown function (DUF4376)
MDFTILGEHGRVVCVASCSVDEIDNYVALNSGSMYVVGGGSPDGRYFADGVFHPIPDKAHDSHVFDYVEKRWIDPRTLQELKAAQRAVIKQARQVAITAPLLTPYGVVDADKDSPIKITQSVLLANNLTAMNLPVEIEFTLADNTTVILDAAQMVTVGLTLALREQSVRGKATALQAQIEAAQTPEEVEAVVWVT